MPYTSPEQMVHNWEEVYERKHTEVVSEADTLHQTVKEQLELLSGEHAVIYDWFSKYVKDNPWQHFGYDHSSPYLRIRSATNFDKNELHKIHASPVPVASERGRSDTNIFLQPYATVLYDSYNHKYSDKGFQSVGWQVIEKTGIDEPLQPGKAPVIIDRKEIVSPDRRFTDFLVDQPYLRVRSGFDVRGHSVRPIYEKSSIVVMNETSEDRLGFLAALRGFQSIHIDSIEHELAQHAAVRQLIERGGIEALQHIGSEAPQEEATP